MNLYCDNYARCNAMVLSRGELGETITYARAKGWHLWAGFTVAGKYVDVRLCPLCVGTPRSQLPPAPVHLRGQLELFEEDEPVADVQRAFDEGVKLQTRSPGEQGATDPPPEAGRDPEG